EVQAYGIGPDGSQVLYIADQDQADVFELYLASLTGRGPTRKLSAPLASGRDVDGFTFTPVRGTIVYTTHRNHRQPSELFSVKTTGTTPALLLNPGATGEVSYLEAGHGATVPYYGESA